MARPKTNPDRPRSVRVPLSDIEFRQLHALAGIRGVPVTELLRQLVAAEFKALKLEKFVK